MMWEDILPAAAVIAALLFTAVWGMYGDQLRDKFPLLRRLFKDKETPPALERKEPVFNPDEQQSLDLEDFVLPDLPDLEEHWQTDFCYAVRFFDKQAHAAARFAPLRETMRRRDINVYRLLGFDENLRQWKIAEAPMSCRYWVMLLPLADRSGSLSSQRIKLLEEDCRRFWGAAQQRVLFPALKSALERAKLIDDFCEKVDIVLELRVSLSSLLGHDEIRELLERNYMMAERDRYVYRLDSEILFSAKPVNLPNNKAREIAFLLDAPRVSQPRRAFEDMIKSMADIATLKDGAIYDKQDAALTDADIDAMRGGIERIVAEMQEKGVPPGCALANLLFK